MDPTASQTLEKTCLCLALTRRGTACQRVATPGKRRCWYHGGGGRERGSGAPEGEANGAYRHGRYTRARREEWRRKVAERQARDREWMAKMPPASYPPGWCCDWSPGAPPSWAHPRLKGVATT
jgi:hypothetical protein